MKKWVVKKKNSIFFLIFLILVTLKYCSSHYDVAQTGPFYKKSMWQITQNITMFHISISLPLRVPELTQFKPHASSQNHIIIHNRNTGW
tara:strand:+ start:697 stop:963 length:267 start_codon:yes stop_codon:yes gene_type:complete